MRRKKVINFIIITFIGILLVCTYFSNTVKNIMLPKVTVVNLKAGAIGDKAEDIKRYDNVIPKSCLSEEDGLDYIFVLNVRDGALGGEEYVQKVQVQVIASDSRNCSIKAPAGGTIPKNYGIIMSTSKPIQDNLEVKLDNEN